MSDPLTSLRARIEAQRAKQAGDGIPYCPHRPTPPQARFLELDTLEALYGGAAGGGKSDCLLMDMLRWCDRPGFHGLVLRRTLPDLALPGAIMDRAKSWLAGRQDVRWSEVGKVFTFGSGARLQFGFCETPADVYRYQGAEFHRIAIDELTQWPEQPYRYLLSRLRRRTGDTTPLGMRAATNPGGIGHGWVKRRFVAPGDPSRAFVPARLDDNPHLNREEYTKSLMNLDPVTRAQLLSGDWEAYEGGMFHRHWFDTVDAAPIDAERCRAWDKAGTASGGDWTVGCLMAKASDGTWFVEDVVRGQWSSFERERVIKTTTEADGAIHGRRYSVLIEQEGGSGGKHSAEITIKGLAGFAVHAERPTGEKSVRAMPLAAQAEAGNVKLVRGTWNRDFLDELCTFPSGTHDDQVDAASAAFNRLALVRKLKANIW